MSHIFLLSAAASKPLGKPPTPPSCLYSDGSSLDTLQCNHLVDRPVAQLPMERKKSPVKAGADRDHFRKKDLLSAATLGMMSSSLSESTSVHNPTRNHNFIDVGGDLTLLLDETLLLRRALLQEELFRTQQEVVFRGLLGDDKNKNYEMGEERRTNTTTAFYSSSKHIISLPSVLRLRAAELLERPPPRVSTINIPEALVTTPTSSGRGAKESPSECIIAELQKLRSAREEAGMHRSHTTY